jgi:hypothetical protein
MPTIKFTDTTGLVPEDYYPTPSKFHIPEWLKRLAPYSDEKQNDQTAKRCIPMLDAVMSGYTIVITEDIKVEQLEIGPYYRWANGLGIDFHSRDQAGTHSKVTGSVAKWLNPWSIQTPRGYSCLFVPPLNNDGMVFTPFAGIVDTDTYIPLVNFPFLLSDPKFEGLVPAGTPMVQVIPFQREAWTMETVAGNTEEVNRATRRLRSVFKNGYRRLFHHPKSFD